MAARDDAERGQPEQQVESTDTMSQNNQQNQQSGHDRSNHRNESMDTMRQDNQHNQDSERDTRGQRNEGSQSAQNGGDNKRNKAYPGGRTKVERS